MLKYIFLMIIFIGLFFSNVGFAEQNQSYFIKKDGKILGNNYFSPAKYYRINNDTAKFLKHTFYLKIKPTTADLSFLKQIPEFNNLKSVSIKKPFATYSKNDLLLKNEQNLSLIYQIHYKSNENPYDICKLLNNNQFVEYAVPVFRQKLSEFVPNDANYATQWGLKKIQAEKAWEISMGDTNIVIGHIDSGTDIEHPDLKNKIKFNPNEIPNDDIDNDDNGFVDDYMGWDFVGNITYNDAVQNNFKPDNNTKPIVNSNSHGTHTAGILAAESNNKIGIAGVSFNCRFMPVKVGMDNIEAPNGSSDIFFGYEAVLYCVRMGCDIINMSWEVLGYSAIEEEIIEYAVQSGVVLVAAAGNSNLWSDKYKTFPAQYPGVITVGSVDEFEKKSSFSSFGYDVDVYAPGSSIYSTMPNSSYSNKSGTSMAAPFVSGAIALLKSIHPNWTPEQIRHQLRATADNSIMPNNALEPFLFGRMNLYNLLKYNNPNFPEFKNPGISISDIKIKDTDEINNFDTILVKLIVKNYLSAANNIEIDLETGDLSLNIYKKKHVIESFAENSEIEIEVPVQITDRNFWHKGNALVTVQIKGENYRNYQLIEIPISLPSYNKYFVAYDMPDDLGLNFFAGDSKADFHVAAIANTGQSNNIGYLLNYGSIVDLKKLPSKANCIFSLNQNENIIGSNGKILISNLTNVKSIDVSTIADNIFGIHLFDNENGFFAGIKSNRMVVGKTKDGGQSWEKVQIPSFSGSETHVLNTNLFSAKDSIIFFTSQTGKYAYTFDFGKTWNTGVIPNKSAISFASIASQNSILILSNENEEQQLNISSDFKNWEKINNPRMPDNVVYVFSPDSSYTFYMLGSHNEVYESTDFGKNWNVTLSQEYAYNSCTSGTGFLKKDGRVRLWNFTSDLTYLDFDNKPINIYKNLTNLSEKTIDFGKLKKDSSAIKFVFFKNNGNYRTTINKVTISPEDNFSENKFYIQKELSPTIASGTIENIQIGFSADLNGTYKAMLEVFSDADTAIHKIDLIATVEDTSGSVILINENKNIKINYENNSIIIVSDDNSFEEIKSINLYDLNGRIIECEQNAILNTIHIFPNNFTTGIYFIEISYSNKKIIIPFLKS